MRTPIRLAAATFGALLLALTILVSACGEDEPDLIRVQLDWTPNTNHTGLYVALAQGWYEDEGIVVEVLPYSGTNGDLLVAEGVADVAFSFATVVPFSRAQGLDVVSIAAVLQMIRTEFAVLEDGPFKRLRYMDG
ncbi:MAG: ABC transporter substrate-binding protein, partial [Chloroflexi bacterium]|nr:ABC transporter substrate-binding protein [Chloroflexota bacterium]